MPAHSLCTQRLTVCVSPYLLCRLLPLFCCPPLCCCVFINVPAGVDFSLIADNEDVLWQPDHRETRAEIQARGRVFMEQVMARPETHIAVRKGAHTVGLIAAWLS